MSYPHLGIRSHARERLAYPRRGGPLTCVACARRIFLANLVLASLFRALMPDANTLTIGVMASLAQHEREMISSQSARQDHAGRTSVIDADTLDRTA